MWALTKDDLTKARNRVSERRRAIEEEMKALDADLAELDAIEHAIEAFFAKRQAASPGSEVTSGADQNGSGHDLKPAESQVLQKPPQDNSTYWGSVVSGARR